MNRIAFLSAFLAILPLGGVGGQEGAFVGVVRDSVTGAPLAGVGITVTEIDARADSDTTGFFRIPGISTGTYTILVRLPGFRLYAMRLNVNVDDDRDLPLGILNLTREYEATLFGSVVDSAGAPLGGAAVTVGASVGTESGPDGTFELPGVLTGQHTVTVRSMGHEPWSVNIDIDVAEPMRVDFGEIAMTPAEAIVLDDVLVSGEEFKASSIMDAFLYRMRTEQGTFLTYEDVERIDPVNTSDILRTVAGLNTLQGGQIASRRAGTSGLRGFGPCELQYYIDGVRVTAPTIDVVLPQTIAGIEVYRGAATVPPIFNSPADSNCGVVAIWTRDGIGGR